MRAWEHGHAQSWFKVKDPTYLTVDTPKEPAEQGIGFCVPTGPATAVPVRGAGWCAFKVTEGFFQFQFHKFLFGSCEIYTGHTTPGSAKCVGLLCNRHAPPSDRAFASVKVQEG